MPYALAVFCCVGVETSLTLFAVPYARDALELPEVRGVRAISAFWLGRLVGRLWLVVRGGRPGPRPLVAAGLFSALALAASVDLRIARLGGQLGDLLGVAAAVGSLAFWSLGVAAAASRLSR